VVYVWIHLCKKLLNNKFQLKITIRLKLQILASS